MNLEVDDGDAIVTLLEIRVNIEVVGQASVPVVRMAGRDAGRYCSLLGEGRNRTIRARLGQHLSRKARLTDNHGRVVPDTSTYGITTGTKPDGWSTSGITTAGIPLRSTRGTMVTPGTLTQTARRAIETHSIS